MAPAALAGQPGRAGRRLVSGMDDPVYRAGYLAGADAILSAWRQTRAARSAPAVETPSPCRPWSTQRYTPYGRCGRPGQRAA
jgi:hypothetical protein